MPIQMASPSVSPSTSAPGQTELQYVRPQMYAEQSAAIFCAERYGYIEASTKSGKTSGACVWLFEQAMKGGPGDLYCWLAPSIVQSDIGFQNFKRGLPPQLTSASKQHPPVIPLPNGAAIEFRTGEDPDKIYGKRYVAAVVDEASRVREEAWYALRSTLTNTRGPVRMIGNVKGRVNWFYRGCRKAESGEPNSHYAKITWHEAVAAGVIQLEEIDDARRTLPEAIFRELYECEPSDDQGNPFGILAIRTCISPVSIAEPWIWGWDLAKKQDYSVGIALDRSGQVCRFERWQRPWQETIEAIRRLTAQKWAFVDSTGVGDPICEALQRQGGTNFAGYQFTAPSKQQLMEGLAVAIQSRKIGYPDGPIVKELESFEYEYTRNGVRYQAAQGSYDDCVCALALAWHGYRQRPQEVMRARDAVIITSEMHSPGSDIPMLSDDRY